MLEAGDIWGTASDIEKSLDEGKQEQCKKCWELPSENQNVAVGIFWGNKTKKQTNANTKKKTKQPFEEVEVMETKVTFIH